MLSRLDYGCATLAGLPRQLLNRLQSADIRELTAQPRDTPSPQSSLATGARVDNVPVGSTRLPLPSRLRTVLLTLLLSYFQSQEPVDNSGYDRRQQRT